MSDIRVLEAITPSGIGGAEVFVAALCPALSEMGARVELFCPQGRPFVDYAADRGIQCVTWKTHGKLDPITLFRLTSLIRKGRFDVVHTHLSTASLLGAFAGKLAGRPSVAHVHGLNTATCFKHSNVVIAVSEAVKRRLCSQGLAQNKVRVVHNGVDIDRFEPVAVDDAKRRLGFDPAEPLFGVFGRLSNEKGQRVALEAVSLLVQHHPKAQLVLVGEGPDRADLETEANALGIAGHVRFAGFVGDVRDLMSACDAVVAPSLKEGFGLAAVEGMALGRPVVATSVGGLTEIVTENQTGFLVPPNNPQALANALIDLLRDKSLADRMGRAGRDRVAENFGLRKQMRKVYSILQEVA
ncbi:MAG: hypothetical protein A2Z18_04500 [Armatimonadetes bacterium RBG_16_58_9]|nr:MAG: hypothetical protein A2Z18_04500 [Armatimonadetes bacterium RBG_16_58_9]